MSLDPFTGRNVWFLTGSQSLYGQETLDRVAAQSRQVAAGLGRADSIPVEVVWQPVLTTAEAIRRVMLEANSDDSCIGVVTWMHTFSPAKMWITGLDVLDKPLLHVHTQANRSLPWATLDMDFMNLNQAAHGDREFGYVQTRLDKPRTTIVGHVEDPAFTARAGVWVRAAAARAVMRSLRLARFGDNMRDVAVTEGDKVEAERHFGTSINTYGVNDLVAVVSQIDDATIDDLVTEYADTFDVATELRREGARHEELREAARIEAGLRAFLTDGEFQAFTTNFQDLGGLKQLPGLGVQRLMAEGYGFGAEGDWKTSMMLRTVKAMGWGAPGGTSFMEDYTYHLGPGPQRILGAHMLEVCPTIAADRPTVEIHPLSIGGRSDPVRLRFTAEPGLGVVVGIADMGARFRLVENEITIVAPDEPLPVLPVGCATWEPHPDLPTAAECWLIAGGPHHTVLSTAVGTPQLDAFAEMTRTELAVIDADTAPRRFRQELRWNQAYFKFSGPL